VLSVAVVTAIWMMLSWAPAHADSLPSISSIVADQDTPCANVCFTVDVANPVAGTITLMLTGHVAGTGDVWPDTGAPHFTLTIAPGTTSYHACFGDVSQFLAGKNFNTTRIAVVASTIPGLQGTTSKSNSFNCVAGSGGSGSSGDYSGSGGSGGSSGGSLSGGSSSGSASGSGSGSSSTTALANTGGFDYRFVLAGLSLLFAGLGLLLVPAARRRFSRG